MAKSRSGSKLREQKSVPGLVTVEEEGKENLGPEVGGSIGGKVEKDGVVEEREVEREEWKGEVRFWKKLFCSKNSEKNVYALKTQKKFACSKNCLF